MTLNRGRHFRGALALYLKEPEVEGRENALRYPVCISLWLLAAGVAQADTREQVTTAGQRFEAELAECYDRVDFEAEDATRQAELCDFEIPSATAVDSTSGSTYDTQIMSAGLRGSENGSMKWSLALSCYENKTTIVAFIADAAENTTPGSRVTYRFGNDTAVTSDWEVLDRTVFIADDDAIELAKRIKERASEELVVTTSADDIESETRFSLKKLPELVDLAGRACGWSG